MNDNDCNHENTARICTPHAQINCRVCPNIEFYTVCDDCGNEVIEDE